MSDVDAPNFRHGGSTVPYDGSGRVREGAIDYIGPCPPADVLHRYVWTIEVCAYYRRRPFPCALSAHLAIAVLPSLGDAGRYMGIWHTSFILPQTIAPFLASLLVGFDPSGAGSQAASAYAVLFLLAAF